jgi:hypothetical protein
MTVSPNGSSTFSKRKGGLSHGLLHTTMKKDTGLKNASWQSIDKESARRLNTNTKMREFLIDGLPSIKSLHITKRHLTRKLSPPRRGSPRKLSPEVGLGNERRPRQTPAYQYARTSSSSSIFAQEIDSLLLLLREDEHAKTSRRQKINQSQNENLCVPADIFIPAEKVTISLEKGSAERMMLQTTVLLD